MQYIHSTFISNLWRRLKTTFYTSKRRFAFKKICTFNLCPVQCIHFLLMTNERAGSNPGLLLCLFGAILPILLVLVQGPDEVSLVVSLVPCGVGSAAHYLYIWDEYIKKPTNVTTISNSCPKWNCKLIQKERYC